MAQFNPNRCPQLNVAASTQRSRDNPGIQTVTGGISGNIIRSLTGLGQVDFRLGQDFMEAPETKNATQIKCQQLKNDGISYL